jgi:hypothetical protein
LRFVELQSEVGVETEEINDFTCRVNFCLENGLSLAEHCRCVQTHSILARTKIGRVQKYIRPFAK